MNLLNYHICWTKHFIREKEKKEEREKSFAIPSICSSNKREKNGSIKPIIIGTTLRLTSLRNGTKSSFKVTEIEIIEPIAPLYLRTILKFHKHFVNAGQVEQGY